MSYFTPIGDAKLLDRVPPPPNEKYAKTKPVVDTGMTVELAQYMKMNANRLKRQPGELFHRVLTSTIANYLENRIRPLILEDGGYASPMDEYHGGEDTAAKSNMVYLVLDCRTVEEYRECHIAGALHYPKSKLHHAVNPFLPEMFAIKNQKDKMIVLYDLDDERVTDVGNALFQKGIDNVAIMAGGLKEFVQDFSKYLIGVSPVPIVPRDERLKRRAELASSSRSEARSMMTSNKPKSLSSSLARPQYKRKV